MKPADLNLLRLAGRPAVAPDGEVFFAVSTPDLERDRYSGVIQRVAPGSGLPVDFTAGPRDSAPVLSPDGNRVVFCRAGDSGPAQLYTMPRHGGEPVLLTEHPLGAGSVVFSPAGDRIAYLAKVPDPGRYGTDPVVEPEAEAPRRITGLSYRLDGVGFVGDQLPQLFVLELAEGASPRRVTAEPQGVDAPVFTPDGTGLLYVRRTAADLLTDEIAVIDADLTEPGVGQVLVPSVGDASTLAVVGDRVVFIGVGFAGNDMAGRSPGLWSAPLTGGPARRLTDEATVQLEPALAPVGHGETVLVANHHRGSVQLLAVPLTAEAAALADIPVVIGGQRVVKSFHRNGSTLAAVVAEPLTPGELVTVELAADGSPGAERVRTELAADLVATGCNELIELTGVAPDGYPVHGFLVLPPGPGPHPVLLDVHGGPHADYTWSWFDEAQVYASAGYAVVLPNPRGSLGYGQEHGRAVVRNMGNPDVADVLALLDVALAREDLAADRVGVMGGSYGGFMTSWLSAHHPDRFVAGISERAVNAWDSFAGSSDIGYFFAEAYVGDDRDEQWRRSPLAYADKIAIPLLIIHSEHDWRCPVEQAQRLYVALRSRGATTEMLLFPAEGHELSRSGRPQHRQQRFEAILQWWGRYLPVA